MGKALIELTFGGKPWLGLYTAGGNPSSGDALLTPVNAGKRVLVFDEHKQTRKTKPHLSS